MKRVWGCGDRKDIERDLSNSSDNVFCRTTLGGIHSSQSRSPHNSTGCTEENGGNATVGRNNSNFQGCDEHRTGAVADPSATREAWELSPRPTNAVDRSSIMHAENAREATATMSNVPPGILGILRRVQSSLAARGMRAAFQLLKGFRKGDQEGNGKVNLSAFKEAVGGAALGLKEAEMRIVFQVRDNSIVH